MTTSLPDAHGVVHSEQDLAIVLANYKKLGYKVKVNSGWRHHKPECSHCTGHSYWELNAYKIIAK